MDLIHGCKCDNRCGNGLQLVGPMITPQMEEEAGQVKAGSRCLATLAGSH